MNKPTETETETAVVKLGNGSRLEVTHWDKANKSLYGRLVGEPGNISVYVPESYLLINLPKVPKSTRKRYV